MFERDYEVKADDFIKGKKFNKDVAEKLYKYSIATLISDKNLDGIDFARDLLIRDCIYTNLVPILKYENNSCYINTILVAMFLRPNIFINKNILLSDRHKEITIELKI